MKVRTLLTGLALVALPVAPAMVQLAPAHAGPSFTTYTSAGFTPGTVEANDGDTITVVSTIPGETFHASEGIEVQQTGTVFRFTLVDVNYGTVTAESSRATLTIT